MNSNKTNNLILTHVDSNKIKTTSTSTIEIDSYYDALLLI